MGRFFGRLMIGLCRLIALLLVLGLAGAIGFGAYRFGGVVGLVGAGIVSLALTVIPSYRNVPTLKLGVVEFLGMRTGRVLGEGPHLVIPVFETVTLLDFVVQTIQVEEQFFCQDNLAVIVEGTLQWRVDKELAARAYLENRHAIPQGLADAIRSEIGGVAGANSALDFKGAWEGISHLINCSLRMGTPPHIAAGISPGARLAFYGDPAAPFRKKLQAERRRGEDRSEIENRYGIEVIAFSVGGVRYTEKTGEALEAEGRARLQMKGKRVIAEAKKEIAQTLKESGLKPQDAEVEAGLTLEIGTREVKRFEGLDRLKPFAEPEARSYGGFLSCRTN